MLSRLRYGVSATRLQRRPRKFRRPSLLRVRPPLQPESDATAARQRNDAKGRVQMIRFPTNTGLLPKIDLQLCFNAISPNSERDGSLGRGAPKCTPKIINCVYRFTSVCKDYVAFHNPGASGCPIGIDEPTSTPDGASVLTPAAIACAIGSGCMPSFTPDMSIACVDGREVGWGCGCAVTPSDHRQAEAILFFNSATDTSSKVLG